MRYVPPVGPANAKIAIVGEAPGRDEEAQGIPFVGASGSLLNQMLNEAGISRNECWVTNVVKERPPNNNFKIFFEDKMGRRPKPVLTHAIEALRDELKAVNPNVIVAVGDNALWALTGLRKIQKRRGSVLESTLIPGAKVVAVLHPAFILREWTPWRYIMVNDLLRVKEESLTPALIRAPRKFILKPMFYEALEELARLKEEKKILSFDIETRGNTVTCIGLGNSPDRAICIPFTRGLIPYWDTIDDEMKIWRAIADLLEDPEIPKVAQNAQYDILFLARWMGIRVQNLWMDTMIAHHELYPETPRGLDFLCSLWTKEPYYKDEGKEVGGRVKDMDLWQYNCKDVVVTLECAMAIHQELIEEGLLEAYKESESFLYPLMTMQMQGVKFDEDRMNAIADDYQAKEEVLQEQLDAIAGGPLNISSNPQMVKFLYADLNLPVRLNDEDRPTADDAALRFLRKHHPSAKPAIDLVLEIRRLKKLRTTYLQGGLLDPTDHRMRCSFDVSGTSTWRLSSKKSMFFGSGTNLQNIPKRADTEGVIRKLFIPDPGKIMFEIDLSQAEARVVSWLCEDEVQIADFLSGATDVHSAYAARLFGIPYEEFMALKKSDPAKYKHQRNMGKVLRHATNYGMSWMGLQQNLIKMDIFLEAKDCKKLLAMAAESAPMLKRWHANIQDQLRKNRTLRTPLGKRRIFGERWGNDLYKQAYAFIPQSTVGHLCNRGLTRIYNAFGDKGIDVLLQVHDAVVGQCDKEKFPLIWQAKTMMEETIIVAGRPLTIPADLTVGMSWGSLEEVKDEQSLIGAVARCV